jgi:hypothetical protein
MSVILYAGYPLYFLSIRKGKVDLRLSNGLKFSHNEPMNINTIVYWGAFFIPLVLLATGAVMQKIVDAQPFQRHHFYMGLDLTVYFLAATLVNFLDIAKEDHGRAEPIIYTVLLVLAALVMLITQIGMHQAWKERTGRMQIFMLCGVANSFGILMLYGFVRLKTRGLL